ncbi:hypothetical protein CMV30_00735 [Nibricoccus aquaticus]|uniref:BRCT domain-containing protein n=1 Tax=Nibricoccus aquaticus TaxID=2576891 RepID=A0A290Q2H3_9BACT|nr:BRCT domain-containing protein [Nibricoccus aquaticus]ATC62613.1 hypothetical protein CMV30_00735 [Nibricoccus aquaticus]
MKATNWVLIDTETSGIYTNPVYCVEIAAQRMRGLEPDGEPFHAFLNHEAEIELGAERAHGYSREYLRRHGRAPKDVHQDLQSFVGSLPVVAYNFGYDFTRVLIPESQRLGMDWEPNRGFCAMALARRCIPQMHSHKLQILAERFLPDAPPQAHQAKGDVGLTIRLLREVIYPLLENRGHTAFKAIVEIADGFSPFETHEAPEFSRSFPESKKLAGLRFVITGTLRSMDREDAESMIAAAGGRTSSSVSGKTDYLLVGIDAGSKLTKARDLGIKLIGEDELFEMLK